MIPSTMSRIRPAPVLLTILLAMNPEISPSTIHARMPMCLSPSCRPRDRASLAELIRKRSCQPSGRGDWDQSANQRGVVWQMATNQSVRPRRPRTRGFGLGASRNRPALRVWGNADPFHFGARGLVFRLAFVRRDDCVNALRVFLDGMEVHARGLVRRAAALLPIAHRARSKTVGAGESIL